MLPLYSNMSKQLTEINFLGKIVTSTLQITNNNLSFTINK